MALETPPLRFFLGLLRPGGILLLAAWSLQHEEVVRAAAAPYAPYFCFGALAVAMLLSWYHDQARLLSSAAAVILTVLALQEWPEAVQTGKLAVMVLLPLNILAFATMSERGVLTPGGLLQVAALGLQVLLVTWMAGEDSSAMSVFVQWGQQGTALSWLPWSAQVAYVGSALGLLVLAVRRRTKVEQGLLWTVVALAFGAHEMNQASGLYLFAGTSGLILMFTVLEHGYDIAYRDELTGLPGRRAFSSMMGQLSGTYSIAVCDIDHFKTFNDRYGHEVGDQALRMVAGRLAQVGGGGRVFRHGGEEFIIVFRGRSAADAEPFADDVRKKVENAKFVLRGPNRPARRPSHPVKPAAMAPPIEITVSIGIAERTARHSTPDRVLDAADKALYLAKEAGRNCVRVSDGGAAPGVRARAVVT
ncbi:MAG TPA: GGDEF domain-containing protein [Vicinamibacterales bacterium]|nr:GGDEF domain-containing protein [Vicinamibacterales bacterium]